MTTFRRLLAIPLLACLAVTGCVGTGPLGLAFTSSSGLSTSDFDAMFPARDQAGLSSACPEFTRELAVRTQRGSKVTIHDDSGRQFSGMLLTADAGQLQLLDCLIREPVAAPNDQRQLQTSFVRFRSLPMSSLTHLMIISSPAAGFVAPKPSDRRDVSIAAVVLQDGRAQPCGIAPEQTVAGDLAGTPIGSLVRVVDETGHQSEGILQNAGPDKLELMTCIEFETVPGPDGVEQRQTNLVPFRTFETSKLMSFTVVAPPSPELSGAEIGEDCDAYRFAEFVSADGDRYRWERPPEREIADEGMIIGDFVPLVSIGRVTLFRDTGRSWNGTPVE